MEDKLWNVTLEVIYTEGIREVENISLYGQTREEAGMTARALYNELGNVKILNIN